MKTTIPLLAVILAVSPAAAQEFADIMPAMGEILAGTDARKPSPSSDKTTNADLWSARRAYLAENDPARKARLREEFDRRLAEVLARVDERMGGRVPSDGINKELWDCRRVYRAESDAGRKARSREECARALDEAIRRSGEVL